MSPPSADFIVVGGGLTGCVIASLISKNSSASVILLEAGSDPVGRPDIVVPLGGLSLLGSDLDWVYQSSPQKHLHDRQFTLNSGKALGGGTVINFGGWLRGSAADYNIWGQTVEDDRWSYKGLLPWMRKAETYFDSSANADLHGFDGKMHVTSVTGSEQKRRYPLRDPINLAWKEFGQTMSTAEQDGNTAGLNEWHENSRDGNRQCAHLAYDLSNIQVKTNKLVQQVLFTNGTATGIRTLDGEVYLANKEVILAAGAYRTPQLLMLSGIGPLETLQKFQIPVIHESPNVGTNLFDHFCNYLAFQLKDPDRGLALGSPHITDPAFFNGLPIDWIINLPYTAAQISKLSSSEHESEGTPYEKSLSQGTHNLVETFAMYVAGGLPGIPNNGTHIATSTMLLLPSSRGSVSLASSDVSDTPAISPNYMTTELDRQILIDGNRKCLQTFLSESSPLADYIEAEVPPKGSGIPVLKPLTDESTDKEIEGRIRIAGQQHYHSGGTCRMGTRASGAVVDTGGKVHGVKNLRVVDASIVPVPLGGHPQASLYPMAEQLAAMILDDY